MYDLETIILLIVPLYGRASQTFVAHKSSYFQRRFTSSPTLPKNIFSAETFQYSVSVDSNFTCFSEWIEEIPKALQTRLSIPTKPSSRKHWNKAKYSHSCIFKEPAYTFRCFFYYQVLKSSIFKSALHVLLVPRRLHICVFHKLSVAQPNIMQNFTNPMPLRAIRRSPRRFIFLVTLSLAFITYKSIPLFNLLFEDGSADAIRVSLLYNDPKTYKSIALIPKIIHQTYKNTSIPLKWQMPQEMILKYHSDYEYMVCLLPFSFITYH